MYYPSNNWYVVRKNCVGTWQVESQQGCFYIPCPNQYKARRVQDYLMIWLRNSHFYRLSAMVKFALLYNANRITFEKFYAQLKVIHSADRCEF